jgi:hypothetical protein
VCERERMESTSAHLIANVAMTKSMNQEVWNKAMETIGVPNQKWDGTRERFHEGAVGRARPF